MRKKSRFYASSKWFVNYRRSFIPKTGPISRVKILSLARDPVPRIIISRSLVAPFISDRRLLFSPEKRVAFHSPPRDRCCSSRCFPACIESVFILRGVLIYWPSSLSPSLNARPHRTRTTPLWTPTPFTITKPPMHFLIPASPCVLCVLTFPLSNR